MGPICTGSDAVGAAEVGGPPVTVCGSLADPMVPIPLAGPTTGAVGGAITAAWACASWVCKLVSCCCNC